MEQIVLMLLALAAAYFLARVFIEGCTTIDHALMNKAAGVHFQTMFAAWIGSVVEEHGDLLNDYAIECARSTAEDSKGMGVLDGMLIETEMWKAVGDLFERYDVLLAPTMATRGLVAGEGYVGKGLEVGGVTLDSYADSLMTPVFNVFSRCPVLNVPSGFADNGVPTGLQVVGRTYDDVTTFRVGAALERVRPFWAGQTPQFVNQPL
jgi:Asp-tRNA(Asn)/Glu-tRNA(Gln) amidotransferase A subunit family amidase